MKKIIPNLIALLFICGSCQFNQSVSKDLITGAYSRADGIGSDDVVMEINGKAETRNEFFYGEKINFVFNNVTGLTTVDGKTYPGLAIYIIGNEKDTLFSEPDVLKNLNDGTELSPLQLHSNFVTALPNKNNEKYKAIVIISDKKGDGKHTFELPFTIKENKVLKIKNKDFAYSNIYLWDETTKQVVIADTADSSHQLMLILEGVEGFKIIDGKAFALFSLEITDANGNKILSSPNMFSNYETTGMSPEDLKKQVIARMNFTGGRINNPYKITSKLKDKNSEKEIEVTTALYLE
ncbi:hypothetical protein ACI6PS_06705 [Flavobacterium sp. PLA-1-15]|uniref:hypothetical protein n=1 Tax=Flavobacterium sp. PLA-1-15 TaxID=3380533 RepID=UPI003B7C25D2